MISDAMKVQHFQTILKLINGKEKKWKSTGFNVLSTALTVAEDGIIFALDVSEECINHGKPYFERANVSHKIKPMIGKAADSLEQLIAEEHSGTFDFVYIDADKVNYDLYYEKSLILLRAGGIVKGLVYKISQSNRINRRYSWTMQLVHVTWRKSFTKTWELIFRFLRSVMMPYFTGNFNWM